MSGAPDYAEVNGVSLRFLHQGSGDPTLVLLHEMGGTLETWDFVAGALAGRHMLRYDMRGAGLSEKVRALTLDDLVADLAGLLDALGIAGPLALAGVAVGAAVAARYAAQHPDRVASLLLMAPATGIAPDRRAATEAIAAEIEGGSLRARIVSRQPANFPEAYRGDGLRPRSARGRALANDPASYAAWYRMLLATDLTPDLPAIASPTLVLAGRDDGTRPPDRVARDAALIPGARFEVVASGHVMPMLTPQIVADRLRALLAAASAV